MMHPRIQMMKVITWILAVSRVTYLAASEGGFYYYTQNGESFCPSGPSQLQAGKASIIGCASLCLQYQCQGYSIQDGECTVLGSLTTPSVGEKMITYQRVSYLASLENAALGKATQSVDYYTGSFAMVKDMAVDGIDGSDNYFHSHTSVVHPWWYVDLGENKLVNEVHVLPYGANGGHASFFTTIEIRIGRELPVTRGDFSSWSLFAYYPGPPSQDKIYLKFTSAQPICGRYVSIQKMGVNPNVYYVFNEVKVFTKQKV
ncbi:uncharacterized protein [Palaemon carinicauda]|uniref:uncharacterized protein n=1 Tax=Palaemon carinicauda TaxID=392227 RepID=UPI0035B5E2CD